MRKLSFIIALLLCVNVSFAQKGKVTSAVSFFTQGKLDKAKELIDEAINHENCVSWPKAYFVKGQIYQAIFETQDENYKKLSKEPLTVAWDAFQKVIQLDEGKKFEKDLKAQYANLVYDFQNQGVIFYNQGSVTNNTQDFIGALDNFKRALEINASPLGTQKVDTILIYNTGIAAQKAGELDQAIEFYKKSLKLNYEASKTYAMLANILIGQSNAAKKAGDTITANTKREEAVKFLQEGHKLYPEDNYMLVELINYYLESDTPAKAEEFLDAAIRLEPGKSDYYRAKGLLYEKLNKLDKAEQMYAKTLELNPNDFAAQYNYGNIQLNKVIEKHKEVNEIMDAKEYNEAQKKIKEMYEAVIPYFEKAHNLNSSDKNTLITLKELYYRLKENNADYAKKYDEVMATLNSL